ncbi:MAG: hypothetical protein COA54_14690 [Thiotrichaceae bacterium]|nr:MAG: hypothetical protein COA54_14690 [Thiotrichaceae bacterium]
MVTRWMWECGYPLINKLSYYMEVVKKGWFESCSLTDYSKYINQMLTDKHLYKKMQVVNVPLPKVFPVDAAPCFGLTNKKYDFPEIFLTVLNSAVVGGGTNFILKENVILHHGLYDFDRDKTSEELHGRVIIKLRSKNAYWLINDKSPIRFEKAATFLDACAGNYSHWLTEVLPRILLFCEDERFVDVPIIINEGLHPNILESLYIVTGEKRDIIALPEGRCLEIDHLYVVSPTGYVPFGVRSRKSLDNPHGVFSQYALTNLAMKMQDHVGRNDKLSFKKILIRRNTGVRSLTNYSDIENLLVDRGFVIIEPEKLDFREQVRVFSQADIVVGATGAALVNLMFCKPHTRIIILMAQHNHMPYWYWQNIACAVKCHATYVLGNIIKSKSLGIHGDFTVDPKDIIAAVDAV